MQERGMQKVFVSQRRVAYPDTAGYDVVQSNADNVLLACEALVVVNSRSAAPATTPRQFQEPCLL